MSPKSFNRVRYALKDLVGEDRIEIIKENNKSIWIRDKVFGVGRFNPVVEMTSERVVTMTVRITELSGDDIQLKQAYEFLLSLNNNPRIKFKRIQDVRDKSLSHIGVAVDFTCSLAHEQLKEDISNNLSDLVLFLEDRYNNIIMRFLEFGLKIISR